jgi:hypothetical protein
MKFSLQVVTTVIFALAGSAGAARTAREGLRRLDASDPVTFSQGGPCIDLPAGTADGSGMDGWLYAIDPEHNDNFSSEKLGMGFSFSLYGEPYGKDATSPNDEVYINNNGNLSFKSPLTTFSSTGFPSDTTIIAPFWADVDTRNDLGHTWYKDFSSLASSPRNVFAVTYENVGYNDLEGDKLNSFQMLISDGTDELMGIGNNICFCYEHMEWTTGAASGGTDGFGGIPATVGANKGDNSQFFQIGRFDEAGSDYDGPNGSSDGVGWLDNKSFCFDASLANIPPIPIGFTAQIKLDFCEELPLHFSFVSPEQYQMVDVAVYGAPAGFTTDITYPSDRRDVVEVNVLFKPTLPGSYQVTFVATDSAGGSTTRVMYILVMGCRGTGGANGDPHFKTWTGNHFDFQGVCDLVLLQSENFGSSLGLDVHIRTTARRDVSYISNAALRIGTDVLEVESKGVFYLNGVAGADLKELSGFPLSHTQVSDDQHEFAVELGGQERIKVKTYKDFVSVLVEQGQVKHFGDSVGLMGAFGSGKMLARDGETLFVADPNAFGQEWQVLDTEPNLFRTLRFPQHPTDTCIMPTPVEASQLRRRLSESSVDEIAASRACEHWGEGKDDCVFDVLATGDLEMAKAGAY